MLKNPLISSKDPYTGLKDKLRSKYDSAVLQIQSIFAPLKIAIEEKETSLKS